MTRARDLAAFVSNADGDIKFDTDTLFIDSSANRVGIGTTTPSTTLHLSAGTSGDAVITIEADTDNNEEDDTPSIKFLQDGGATTGSIGLVGSSGQTFTNSDSNNMFIHAVGSQGIDFATGTELRMRIDNTGQVGIGTDPAAQLHIKGTDVVDQVILENTDDGANSAPDLVFFRNSASPADGDALGRVDFQGKDDAGNSMDYALILAQADDVTNGSEDGRLKFYVASGGEVAGATDTETLTLVSPEDIRINISADTSDVTNFMVIGGTSGSSNVLFGDTGDVDVGRIRYDHTDNFMSFTVNASDAMHIKSDGKVGIGTTSPLANLHIQQTTDTATIRLHRTGSSNAVNAALGAIEFFNADGSGDGPQVSAKIAGTTHTTSGAGGRFAFFVHDGAEASGEGGSPIERVRINGNGITVFDQDAEYSGVGAVSGHNTDDHQHVVVSGSGYIIINRFGNTPLYLNRMSNDGVLVNLYAQGNVEGTISVSGSTVSYNGGHLSRYSQLADNTKDTSIVKGTVMTNLDQMAEWTHAAKKVGDDILDVDGTVVGQETEAQDARTELNEQLNCMAVSSVEGDPNVAGVFVNWDEDDDVFTNDMNVAMTGDMVIRIAKGVTIARGDLLMSAGDGTAKPQGDDIVRSKTIAKVTSTNVSHTYDDESFLVPCVLMAC